VTGHEEVSPAVVDGALASVPAVADISNQRSDGYLRELLLPPVLSPANAAALLSGPRLTPRQHIWFYSADDWEEFVREWAALLPGYVSIKRFGGTNDRGIDIAGLLSEFGLEGPWDCYQCKHYSRPLEPGDARAEILKILCGVADGYYMMPRKYRFLAPQGCGPGLSRLLSSPSRLKADFLGSLDPTKPPYKDVDRDLLDRVRTLVNHTDFSVFGSEDLDSVLATHQRSPNHLVRFGGQLPSRPQPTRPPMIRPQRRLGTLNS
jgi:hypothetical protein